MTLQDDAFFDKMVEILDCETCDGAPTTMDALLPHVFIGNIDNAESLWMLRRNRITHVLNCAGYKGPRSYEGSPYKGLDIDYKEIMADDTAVYDIGQHFAEAFDFLDKVKFRRGCALVHCVQGVNRSAAICVAYLMMERNMKLLQAIRLIKRKRNVALCNKGFLRQLLRFARQNNRLENVREAALSSARVYRKSSCSADAPITYSKSLWLPGDKDTFQNNHKTERRRSFAHLSAAGNLNSSTNVDLSKYKDTMFEMYIQRRMQNIFIK